MKTYFAVVEKDADSAFGAWFPEVDGCFSASDAEGDVLRNAMEALDLHLADGQVPAPQGIDAIKANEDVSEALARGAFLLRVPYVNNSHKTVRANLSFERGLLAMIDDAADMRGLSRSAFIAQATMREIQEA